MRPLPVGMWWWRHCVPRAAGRPLPPDTDKCTSSPEIKHILKPSAELNLKNEIQERQTHTALRCGC